MSIKTVNPTTGKLIKEYKEMSDKELSEIIDASHAAFLKWSQTSFDDRAKLMRNAADLLNKNKKEYADIITMEMGKPTKAAQAEVEKCAWVCDHYADNAEEYLKPRMIKTEMAKSYVTYQPLGVVFAIMPWNFPFWQVFRFAAPTLMAGNAGILKHAPISTGTALAIEQLFADAGFPENLFRSVIADNEGAAKIIANPKVIAVTLTGSERAGSAVGAESAKNLKKVVLELGGCDPYVILDDADLELAAEAIVTSRMNNSGQVCIAAKRIIATDAVRDKLQQLLVEKVQRYQMGDPTDEKTNFGPLAREDIRNEVHKQVRETIDSGATLITGGVVPERKGYYYPPTILSNVKKGMTAFDSEIFGPVISIVPAKDEDEAIELANATKYGLAGAVFTSDTDRGEKIARDKIHAGSVAVNTYVASDPRVPFGGIKLSGYGRELSAEGIREFVNVKTVSIK